MRFNHVAALLVALTACTSRTNPTPQDSTSLYRVTTESETTLVRVSGPMVRPESGPEALARWKPDIPAVDSGGECSLSRSGGSGATFVRAAFPSLRDAKTSIHLSFDSAGRLIRFSETRGRPNAIQMPPGVTSARVRDSILIANVNAERSTNISLDFALDNGLAMNRGADQPTTAVRGNVREMEGLENLGPPKARIARARRLCGV